MKEFCLGVDIGGTAIKMGLFTVKGELHKKWEIKTDTSDKGANILSDIAESIRKELKAAEVALTDCLGVGMGVPGPVLENGYVESCVNLGWRHVYPARELSDLLEGIFTGIANDANAAALGEYWQGGAKGYSDVVLLTLGTGVGGGVILNGRVLAGRHGLGGEIGHIHVREEETEHCNCGGRGCLEQIASATGIVREARRVLEKSKKASALREKAEGLSAKDVLDGAKAGDALALEVMERVGKYLGIAVSHVALLIDPDVIVIGGGVSRAGDFLIDLIDRYYDRFVSLSRHRPNLILAELGNDAGIYGAARLVL